MTKTDGILSRTQCDALRLAITSIPLYALLISISVLTSCQSMSPVDRVSSTRERPREMIQLEFDPAGNWIYMERGMSYPLTLDQFGNGNYRWREGYFITTGITDGYWSGTWHQPGNDREGRFELRVSEDKKSATGKWWYTRIGDNKSPQKAGGVFTLSRELQTDESETL